MAFTCFLRCSADSHGSLDVRRDAPNVITWGLFQADTFRGEHDSLGKLLARTVRLKLKFAMYFANFN